MSATALGLWLAALAGCVLAARRDAAILRGALAQTRASLLTIAPIMAIALPTAGFLGELVPERFAASLLGPGSGLAGHLAATVAGACIPGGPFVSFPVVLALWSAGAGPAQMVTLISAWSVLGLNRVVLWEGPLMGWRFVTLRLAATAWLPPLSGLAAEAILACLPPGVLGR
ncbi:hypothetical protein FK498_18730 [Elioraea sp. Yellowstone]|jgi:uncharacterized membrane protein YraQ (UPF0718 family)|uniref:hypothetical protein n=1 Tax=Elioraea sp. Yellowstone TaxID=2592070 RepID=UPI001153EB8C|nr:hypothetical protein [Elioraea sp. Yellowstone]TQF76261.1 hypothetical protein FK498_18730 [Elioraea sp. Yellowstone]